ncbi:MAG TPA: hypothetical protein VKX17_13150 [Planctomycetota bacterium]|nr:hypothetical protein [Planctomycetota bacterium]
MTDVTARPAIANATQKIKEGAVELKSAVVDGSTEAFQKCYDTTESKIRSAPYTSVMIAFGIGAVLGALLFRR